MNIDKKDAGILYEFYKWEKEEIQSFVNLDYQNLKIVRTKYISLVIFIVFFLFYGISGRIDGLQVQEVMTWDLGQNFLTVMIGFCAYIFVHVCAYLLHWLVFTGVTIKAKVIPDKEALIVAVTPPKSKWHFSKGIMNFIFTPDYFWAGFFKDKIDTPVCGEPKYRPLRNIETVRNLKKYYIERSNWFNLIGTIVFILIIFVFLDWIERYEKHFLQLIILFVSMRIISRSLEIMVAFYNDVMVQRERIFLKLRKAINPYKTEDLEEHHIEKRIYINSWKNSQLLGFNRASLALHSLVEVVLIFAVIYMLLAVYFDVDFPAVDKVSPSSRDELGLVKYFLFSFTSSVSFPTLDVNFRWAIPQALQLLTSVVLVIMSFAYYLGKDSVLLPHERDLFILKKGFKPQKKKSLTAKWLDNRGKQ